MLTWTGQSCSYYVIERGRYALTFADLAAQPDFTVLYVELWDDATARKLAWAKPARNWFAASAMSR